MKVVNSTRSRFLLNFPLFQSLIIIDPILIEHGQIYFEHMIFPNKGKRIQEPVQNLKRSKNTDKENI